MLRIGCIYEIHLLFSTVFYIFKDNLVIFGLINMFLGAFWRVFKGLQKTGPNQSNMVHLDWSFCSLYISKTKRPDCRSSLFQSWSGLFLVFFWSCDQTFKHYWHEWGWVAAVDVSHHWGWEPLASSSDVNQSRKPWIIIGMNMGTKQSIIQSSSSLYPFLGFMHRFFILINQQPYRWPEKVWHVNIIVGTKMRVSTSNTG